MREAEKSRRILSVACQGIAEEELARPITNRYRTAPRRAGFKLVARSKWPSKTYTIVRRAKSLVELPRLVPPKCQRDACRIAVGALPVQRLKACVNALTSW